MLSQFFALGALAQSFLFLCFVFKQRTLPIIGASLHKLK
uniref:Uncharacterized protein n=1 Tax=Vibrio sp. FF_273 TaxID=1652830 RepID=A0A0H3ZX75_9VIBR|nr:hypothetical protein [Vibrio sp. FF_273]